MHTFLQSLYDKFKILFSSLLDKFICKPRNNYTHLPDSDEEIFYFDNPIITKR